MDFRSVSSAIAALLGCVATHQFISLETRPRAPCGICKAARPIIRVRSAFDGKDAIASSLHGAIGLSLFSQPSF
jgi:hypothetical protein